MLKFWKSRTYMHETFAKPIYSRVDRFFPFIGKKIFTLQPMTFPFSWDFAIIAKRAYLFSV